MSLVNSFRDRIVAMVADAFPQLVYGSVYEYRVTPSSTAGRFDLVPVRTRSIGELPKVYQWGGPGIEATYDAGASVLVAFIDADQTRPVVIGYQAARLPGGIPTATIIDATTGVSIGPSLPTITLAVGGIVLGAAVGRVGDFVARFYRDTVTGILYVSASPGAPYAWSPVASGAIAPTIATAGTAINISAGSTRVFAG